MKALILAGGKGSRLRPITYSIAKQLVPVANKPVIEYGIEAIRESGIRDFGIIVGDSETEIREALGDGSRWDARFAYIRQSQPLGLAHAVKTAQPYLEDSRFIMYLGDNLIKGGVRELVDEFESASFDASILLTHVPNPGDFGVAELDGDRVVRLEEKPRSPRSDLALVGVYLFNSSVFDAIDRLKPSFRGEYEITDAIQYLIDCGKDVRSHIVTGWWKDTGTVEAMLDANRLILQGMDHTVEGELVESELVGSVTVNEGARIVRSRIFGPAIVGPGCEITDSEIGQFTSVAAGSRIADATVRNSIVMDEASITGVGAPIEDSIIGRGVRVGGSNGDGPIQLVLGDHSSVTIPKS
jgi:glucose-1-phosphate thymidylyltransferase